MKQGRLDRLHAHKAAMILAAARDDWQAGRLDRPRAGHRAASALALAILAVPPLLLLGAIWLAVAVWPAPLGLVVAALIAALALFLMPRPVRLPRDLLRPADMPATFAHLDRICDALDAPRVTALLITDDAGASIGQPRGEVLMTIGALTWVALDGSERQAVLAHEIGHLVNEDPRRDGLIWKARHVLDRWISTFAPEDAAGESIAAEIVQVTFGLVVEALDMALIRLTYPDSQRAEYLADAHAARIAGSGAIADALMRISHAPLLSARFNRLYGPTAPKGAACLDWLAQPLTAPDPIDTARITEELASETHAVDADHPPTAHRLAFLRAIDLPPGDLPLPDGPAIAAEWAPHLDRIGNQFRAETDVQ